MADLGQFAKNANIQALAGTNANATAKATAATDVYVLDVEAKVNVLTRFDWSTADSTTTIHASVRGILVETASALCAIKVIQWDMSGFTSRAEAEDMISVLRDIALTNMSLLRDKKQQKFIQDTV